MTKTEILSNLFDDWEKAQLEESDESLLLTISGKNIRKESFERDGIIDEEAFNKEKVKVLFITAEANVDDYGASKGIVKTNYRDEYLHYFKTGKDEWRGKMRERICAIYGFITNQKDVEFHLLANKFAVMDLNKRGGKKNIDDGSHIVEYTKIYKDFMIQEIEIINPDLIVWIGQNTYFMNIPELLGSVKFNGNKAFRIKGKAVPILKMWQTSYYQAKIDPLPEYRNRTIGKLCAKAKLEMELLGIRYE